MSSLEFNNDPLNFPGSVLNPSRYKLPSKLIRFPLELPTDDELPDRYGLPSDAFINEIDLPGLSIEEEMELGAIPRPFVQTVRFIHSGITPSFDRGVITLDGDSTDIHHIVKRSYVKADRENARALLPFNGAIKGTFDLLTTPYAEELVYNTQKIGGMGHMLINLIPLEYHFHHSFVEAKPYAHVLNIRVGKHQVVKFTIPEILMGFNIFNLRLRQEALANFIQNGLENCIKVLNETEDGKVRLSKQYHLFAWQQMQLELLRIPLAAEEIEMEHPHLFLIWKRALGLGPDVVTLSRHAVEQ